MFFILKSFESINVVHIYGDSIADRLEKTLLHSCFKRSVFHCLWLYRLSITMMLKKNCNFLPAALICKIMMPCNGLHHSQKRWKATCLFVCLFFQNPVAHYLQLWESVWIKFCICNLLVTKMFLLLEIINFHLEYLNKNLCFFRKVLNVKICKV